MSRTNTTFVLLQATAAVLALATVLWSVGLPVFRFAEAANVTSLSDTLSDSAPSVASNHTLTFVTPSGVPNGQTITVDFSNGPFVVGSVDFTDIDVVNGSTDLTLAATCAATDNASAAFSGTTLTITFCAGDGASLSAGGTTTIRIGTNATFGTTGNAALTNPAVGSYQIGITAGASDVGTTRVAIISPVVVTAAVDTNFTFSVAGQPSGGSVNGESVTGTSTATAVAFGTLVSGVATTAAQQLSVSTNASYGYAVTVSVNQQLISSSGADIDGFIDGAFTSTPVAWVAPSSNISNENTWGHWGLTSDDATFGASNPYGVGLAGQLFVSASTTPVEVLRHSGPADGTTQNIGRAKVGYKVQISPLQEAGTDYTATLTYVATPVF